MSRAHDLTSQAREGYNGNVNPYLYSSPSWYAFQAGIMLHATGRNPPSNVRMGRGSIVHVNDMSFKHTDNQRADNSICHTWERIK